MSRDVAAELSGLQLHLDRVEGILRSLQQGESDESGDKGSPSDIALPEPPESGSTPSFDPLSNIIRRFCLSVVEADMLRIAAASEFEPDIASTFAQLQGDRRTRRARVDLAMRMLEPDPDKRPAILTLLHEQGALRRNRLLEFPEGPGAAAQLLTEQALALDRDLVFQVAGSCEPTTRWPGALRLVRPEMKLDQLKLPESVLNLVEDLVQLGGEGQDDPLLLGPERLAGVTVYLHGHYGVGRRQVAEVLAGAWGLNLLLVDCRMIETDVLGSPAFAQVVLRDATRLGALPTFLHVERFTSTGPRKEVPDAEDAIPIIDLLRLERFLDLVAPHRGPVVLCGEEAPVLDRVFVGRETIPVGLPDRPENNEARNDLWWETMSELPGDLDREQVVRVAQQFSFSPGEIRDVAKAAYSHAAARNPEKPQVNPRDLYNGAVAQFRHNMGRLSTKTRTVYSWDDLILPEDVKTQLRRLESFLRNRELVFDSWGLGRRIGLSGRGVKALFTGKSGTGKTMAAQVISSKLGIDLYKVDLAMVFNKYVGETEKGIKRIFTEAKKSHAMILFDEADSLFGKRQEDGQHRWASMLVNYLLQEFEDYDGGAILTTNFASAMDNAFARRLNFVIEFPEPEEDMRLKLWRMMIPEEMPLADDVNLKRLARKFELTGGNIRNIVMGAAFMSVESGSQVTMLHVMRAVQDEFRKVGRTSSKSDFREYFDQLT